MVYFTPVDYYLANGDSSQNEVKRCQSFVGDVTSDGGNLVWEYKRPYKGLSEKDIEEKFLGELQRSEMERMKYNIFRKIWLIWQSIYLKVLTFSPFYIIYSLCH